MSVDPASELCQSNPVQDRPKKSAQRITIQHVSHLVSAVICHKLSSLHLHRRTAGGDHQYVAATARADRFEVKVDSNHGVGAHRLPYQALLSRLRFQKNLYTFVGELKICNL